MTRRKLTDEEKLEKEQRQKQYRKDYYLKNKDRIIAQAIANGKKRDHIHKVLYNLYVDGLLRVVDNETDMIDKAVVIPSN